MSVEVESRKVFRVKIQDDEDAEFFYYLEATEIGENIFSSENGWIIKDQTDANGIKIYKSEIDGYIQLLTALKENG